MIFLISGSELPALGHIMPSVSFPQTVCGVLACGMTLLLQTQRMNQLSQINS